MPVTRIGIVDDHAITRRAPMLGEHNYEVYHGELGLDATQLVALAGSGAI